MIIKFYMIFFLFLGIFFFVRWSVMSMVFGVLVLFILRFMRLCSRLLILWMGCCWMIVKFLWVILSFDGSGRWSWGCGFWSLLIFMWRIFWWMWMSKVCRIFFFSLGRCWVWRWWGIIVVICGVLVLLILRSMRKFRRLWCIWMGRRWVGGCCMWVGFKSVWSGRMNWSVGLSRWSRIGWGVIRVWICMWRIWMILLMMINWGKSFFFME